MFATQIVKPFQALVGAIATGTVLMAVTAQAEPPQAAEAAVHTLSVMNQPNPTYEATLKFYLHPARLEVTEPSHEMMDHPVVIVAHRKETGFDWTTAFILHPARLAVVLQTPQPTIDRPATSVANAKPSPSTHGTKPISHQATVAKAKQDPYVYPTRFTPSPAQD